MSPKTILEMAAVTVAVMFVVSHVTSLIPQLKPLVK